LGKDSSSHSTSHKPRNSVFSFDFFVEQFKTKQNVLNSSKKDKVENKERIK
jgi:hypothetical protein